VSLWTFIVFGSLRNVFGLGIGFNIRDIRSFSGTKWKKNLGGAEPYVSGTVKFLLNSPKD